MGREEKKSAFFVAAQRILLTAELFGRNELANHAAAGAYGFLLSAAPAILIAAFFITRGFSISADDAARMLSSFKGIGEALDVQVLVEGFLSSPLSGLSGAIALANLLWTARVFALSILRGIRVVNSESGTPTPVRNNVLTVLIELAALLFIVAYTLSTRISISLGRSFAAALPSAAKVTTKILLMVTDIAPLVALMAFTYLAIRTLPLKKPTRRSALGGALLSTLAYALVSTAFTALTNLSRYDLVYGVLGALIVTLANVYFFFTFFFLGAQFAFVVDSFDSLAFTRFRRSKQFTAGKGNLERRLFSSPQRLLGRYARSFGQGEAIFERGDRGKEVFFIVSGEVEIVIDGVHLGTMGAGSIFGEMAYLLSEPRTASAMAATDAIILALPPELFEDILSSDPETARHVVETLSIRLRNANERLN